jgi:hypothetical protein
MDLNEKQFLLYKTEEIKELIEMANENLAFLKKHSDECSVKAAPHAEHCTDRSAYNPD